MKNPKPVLTRSLPAIGLVVELMAGLLNAPVRADETAPAHSADQNPPAATTNGAYRLPTITISATALNPEPQSAAGSITVLAGSQIGPGGITEIRDFPAIAPNLSVFDGNNNRTPKFSVRGLRENNFAAGDPVIGLYIDDIPYSDLNSRGLPLFDIEQVDFLRGPQGTLYGAGGPGGVINVYTRQPGNELHGCGTFSYGNYNDQTYQAAISGPLVKDNLFLGVSGLFSQRDGFVNNLVDNSHPDTRNALSGRAQLRWTPNEAWDISLIADANRFNDGFVPTFNNGAFPAPGGTDPDLFNVRRDFDGFVKTKSYDQTLKVGYQTPDVKVTSVTSHRYWKQDLQQDFDFSAAPGAIGFTDPRLKQWSEELRFQSPEGASPFQWLGGFYFVDNNTDANSGSILPSGAFIPPATFIPGVFTDRTTAQFEDHDYALFGQATYTIGESLDLLGGLRLEYDDRTMHRQENNDLLPVLGAPQPANIDSHDHFANVLPKAGLAYRFTPKQSVYVNAAEGFQPGGFNQSSPLPNQARYGSANSWNLETGYKASWFDEKLTSRVALFYSWFHDYQTYQFNTNNPTEAFILNAKRAHSYGAELELEAHPTQDWEFSTALGYTQAKYDSFTDPVNVLNFAGRHISFTPQFTIELAAQYNFCKHLYTRVELQGLGDDYLNEANSARQAAYVLFNARAGYQQKHFEIYIYGKNLFDKRYANNALDFGGPVIFQPGDPMTFGIALTARL